MKHYGKKKGKRMAMGGPAMNYAEGGPVMMKTPNTAKGKMTSGKARGMGAASRGGKYTSC